MKSYKFKINNNDFSVDIISSEDNIIELEVNGTPFCVELENSVPKSVKPATIVPKAVTQNASAPVVNSSSAALSKIEAPLPGTILSVSVKEGDQVKLGQALLVMEAMKMENTVQAESNGVVKSVKVKPQDTVQQGDILVEIA